MLFHPFWSSISPPPFHALSFLIFVLIVVVIVSMWEILTLLRAVATCERKAQVRGEADVLLVRLSSFYEQLRLHSHSWGEEPWRLSASLKLLLLLLLHWSQAPRKGSLCSIDLYINWGFLMGVFSKSHIGLKICHLGTNMQHAVDWSKQKNT